MATLLTLAAFGDSDGEDPATSLLMDANGDLIGTTLSTVFELSYDSGYASTPTTLATFPTSGADGDSSYGDPIFDSNGDILGTTLEGGSSSEGVVYEIYNFGSSYDTTPEPLVSFDGTDGEFPEGGLLADAGGDLFGTAGGGASGYGAVYELANTRFGLSSTPTTLVAFDGTDGNGPMGNLIQDAQGNLFGSTEEGGTSGYSGPGTVFEIEKTASGFSSTPTTLANFVFDVDGNLPSQLIMDAAGDLFGEAGGGYGNYGSVFEIAKTNGVYASAPTTLAAFGAYSEGAGPEGGLIMDAKGDLFGTTESGGAYVQGAVFEIVKTSSGYSSTPVTLASFDWTAGDNYAEGADPIAGVIANAAGDLFGTTTGGGNVDGVSGDGTIFEVTDSGFVIRSPNDFNGDGTSDLLWYDSSSGKLVDWTISNGAFSASKNIRTLPPTGAWKYAGTGDFNGDGTADVLLENSNGAVDDWRISNGTYTSSAAIRAVPSGYSIIGTGDFNGEGTTDILLQDTTTGLVKDWIIGANKVVATNALGTLAPATWTILGTGDFAGNGVSDILWQNTSSGELLDWTIVNGRRSGSNVIRDDGANLGAGWTYVANGDFTGGGTSDLLFENTDGALMAWDLSNGKFSASEALGVVVPTGFAVVGAGDYTGNGVSDVLIHNATTGAAEIGIVSGGQISAWTSLGSQNPASGWKLIA